MSAGPETPDGEATPAFAAPELTITWGPRARALVLLMPIVFAALAVWGSVRPGASAATVLGSAAMALVGAGLAIEAFYARTEVSARGLTHRTLRGRRSITWPEVRLALLVASRQYATTITHRRTLDPERATHVILVGASGTGRRWAFNCWMTGFTGLLREVAKRDLIAIQDPEAAPPSFADKAAKRLEEVNAGLTQLIMGFAFLFFLFVASCVVVTGQGLVISGDIFVDVGLVAAAMALVVRLIAVAAWLIGGARYGGSTDPRERQTNWLMNATGLVGGVLFIYWFLPRALSGDDERGWVLWILVAMGAFIVYGSLRDWLRGE